MFWRSNNDQSKRMSNFYPKGLKIDFCTVPSIESAGSKTIELGYCGATKWAFAVEKKEEKLSVALNCSPSESCLSKFENWSVEADVMVQVRNQKMPEKGLTASGFSIPFDREGDGHNWNYSFDKINEKNGFVRNGSVMFQINIGINEIKEIYSGDFVDFSVPQEDDSDVVLLVGDRKFHVSKQVLSTHSPVFKAMFHGNFNESVMNEIPMNNVDLNAFHIFLQYIYMAPIEICDENVSQLILMGDQFGVKKLVRECENFLLRPDVDEKDAIALAVFHSLDRVLCEKITSKTVEQLKSWVQGQPLPPAAAALLKQKLGTDTEKNPKSDDLEKKSVEKENSPKAENVHHETSSTSSSDSTSDSDSDSDSDA